MNSLEKFAQTLKDEAEAKSEYSRRLTHAAGGESTDHTNELDLEARIYRQIARAASDAAADSSITITV